MPRNVAVRAPNAVFGDAAAPDGKAIPMPMLMVLWMITSSFLAMSSCTDKVRPSPSSNSRGTRARFMVSGWRIGI